MKNFHGKILKGIGPSMKIINLLQLEAKQDILE